MTRRLLDHARWLRALRLTLRQADLPAPDLDALVRSRLRSVLTSAFLHVPYYRAQMRTAGYDPRVDYGGPGDLVRLPLLTRATLKSRPPGEFLREDFDRSRSFEDHTSGSTGMPLAVYREPSARAVQVAKWLRVLYRNGYTARDRVLSLTNPIRIDAGRSALQRLGLFQRLAVDNTLPIERQTDCLLDYRPDVLYGGRSFLELIWMELARRGAAPIPMKLVVATNEIVREGTRRMCREWFQTDLIESYGSVEMGVMAHETRAHDGLHLCEDLTYFEFLDDDGRPAPPGRRARIVVTDLTGTMMPFIRYEQGDRVEYAEVAAPDGSIRRRIVRVEGRDNDYMLLPDGGRATSEAIQVVLDGYLGIRQFRIIQRTRTRFEVELAGEPSHLQGIKAEVSERLARALHGVQFDLREVDHIAPDPSGKSAIFISEAV